MLILLGVAGIVLLLVLILLRIPIVFCFAVVGVGGTLLLKGWGPTSSLVSRIPWAESINFTLMALPMFVLMGEIATNANIGTELYQAAHKWIGQIKGGLGVATVAACAGFSAICGSSVATAATIGAMSIPEMRKYKYDMRMATGCVASAGTLAILIPPSGVMIIFSALTDASLGKLFMAGFIPGILLAFLYAAQIYIRASLNPALAPAGPSFPWKERFVSLRGIWAMLALFVLVMGGIYGGVFSPTEAAAVGAFGAFAVMIAKRRFNLVNVRKALLSTGRTTCMIMAIIIAAMGFNYFLALTRVPQALAEGIVSLGLPTYGVLLLIILVYIVLGMFMEIVAMMVLTIPIFIPMLQMLGLNIIWIGIVITILMEMAQITPPVGLAVYVIRGVAPDVPLGQVFAGIWPFFAMQCLLVILLIVFPQIALFLPSLMKY